MRSARSSSTQRWREGYVYDGAYMSPAEGPAAFARWSSTPITASRTRGEITLWKDWQGTLGGLDARSLGLGGWTLSAHLFYDPIGHTLYLGDGRRRRAETLGGVLTTVAGGGCCALGDGGPAKGAGEGAARGV